MLQICLRAQKKRMYQLSLQYDYRTETKTEKRERERPCIAKHKPSSVSALSSHHKPRTNRSIRIAFLRLRKHTTFLTVQWSFTRLILPPTSCFLSFPILGCWIVCIGVLLLLRIIILGSLVHDFCDLDFYFDRAEVILLVLMSF